MQFLEYISGRPLRRLGTPEMTRRIRLRLADLGDVERIARMSRDLIETDLGWKWQPKLITRQILDPNVLVVAASDREQMIGFGSMQYLQHAHLNLLAVRPSHQGYRIGRFIVEWLEESALSGGISQVVVEARTKKEKVRAFYRSLGYREVEMLPHYYRGMESAIRMVHFLRSPTAYIPPGKRQSPIPFR